MLRREPTSVTLETKDIEIFKELVKNQQLKKDAELNTLNDKDLDDRDDIFMGRSISRAERKRDLQSRLGLEEEEEEDIEGPLFKKTHL